MKQMPEPDAASAITTTQPAGTDELPSAGKEMLPIGRVASLLGVSERTLRYYEEVGLVVVPRRSVGQRRRYTQENLARLREIRELQEVMGYSLDEIRTIFVLRDQLEAIRATYHQRSWGRAEQARLLEQAAELMEDQRTRVQAKVVRLQTILGDLEGRLERCRQLHEEISAKAPA